MTTIDKFVLKYGLETVYETYDQEEAQNMKDNFNDGLKEGEVILEIHEVEPNRAVKDLLLLVKEKKALIELQSQNFKKMNAKRENDLESFCKTIDMKDELLKAQGQLVVELQKKCEEMTKIINLPQNRAQRDLLKQMERCKQLEREKRGGK